MTEAPGAFRRFPSSLLRGARFHEDVPPQGDARGNPSAPYAYRSRSSDRLPRVTWSGTSVEVMIYRGEQDKDWILEVVDHLRLAVLGWSLSDRPSRAR